MWDFNIRLLTGGWLPRCSLCGDLGDSMAVHVTTRRHHKKIWQSLYARHRPGLIFSGTEAGEPERTQWFAFPGGTAAIHHLSGFFTFSEVTPPAPPGTPLLSDAPPPPPPGGPCP